MKRTNNHINYVEFKAKDLEVIKQFYTQAFDWKFTDYGPNYTAFAESGIAGGFEKTNEEITNGALVVLRHSSLDLAKKNVIESGGSITVDTFSFPGGSRFQFADPSGNELAIWCEAE